MLEIVAQQGGEGFCLIARQSFAVGRARLFPFFSAARNLERITPSFLGFRVVTPAPIAMQQGTEISYRLSLHGIPLRWRSVISEWQPPFAFTDEQLAGPYKSWRHRHTFVDTPYGCDMTDRIDYGVLGGAWINRLFVVPDLQRIFAFRRQALIELFGPEPAAAGPD